MNEYLFTFLDILKKNYIHILVNLTPPTKLTLKIVSHLPSKRTNPPFKFFYGQKKSVQAGSENPGEMSYTVLAQVLMMHEGDGLGKKLGENTYQISH